MVKIYKQPFAHDGDTIAIPDASQPDGKMSGADGWTPDYQLPKTNPNYKPVGRQEMNGVFKEVTEAVGEIQQFGFAKWQPMQWPQGARVVEGGVVYRALNQTSQQPPHADWVDDMDALIRALGTAATRDVTVGTADVIAGRLLKVGDLGSNKHISAVFDFNDLPELYPYSGLIPFMSNAGSTNKPPRESFYHVFQTIFVAENNVTQIAIPYRVDDDGFFLRSRHEGAWSQWREVLHTGNILTATGSSTTHPMTQKAVTDALIGVGQTLQDVTGSRVVATTYTNTTGKPIYLFVIVRDTNGVGYGFSVSGVDVNIPQDFPQYGYYPLSLIIPVGGTYSLSSTMIFSHWLELR